MNNITFGDENVGYYETVAGGAGAVSWDYFFIFNLILLNMNATIYVSFNTLIYYSFASIFSYSFNIPLINVFNKW